MSVTEMVNAAKGTGLTGKPLIEAIAISLAENQSSDPHLVYHNTNGTVDRGYWQINSVHSQYDASRLLNDPDYNAHAMFEISKGGTDWSPWATYPAKAQAKLGTATNLASGSAVTSGVQNVDWGIGPVPDLVDPFGVIPGHGSPVGPGTSGIVGGVTDAIAGPLKAIGSLTSHLLDGRWWARVGQGALALLLLIGGLLIIFRKQAGRLALDVATDGIAEAIPKGAT